MLRLKTNNQQHGFTIVELLIVIVVIGILAAISVVAYTNVSSKARVSALSSALSQASKKLELYRTENGNYPAGLAVVGIASDSSAAYTYTATDGNANYCLTAVSGDISYSLNNSTRTSPTEGGCNGHAWPGGVVMTNLVANGDFSQGTSGWASYDSTMSVNNKIMTNTIRASPGHSNGFIYPLSFTYIANHIYFFSAKIKVLNSESTSAQMSMRDSPVIAQQISPVINQWYALSSRQSYSADLSSMVYRIRHFYPNVATAANKSMEIKEVTAIDLTAAFGAGNEPTKAQMDKIMEQFPNNWFNGTVTANTKGVL